MTHFTNHPVKKLSFLHSYSIATLHYQNLGQEIRIHPRPHAMFTIVYNAGRTGFGLVYNTSQNRRNNRMVNNKLDWSVVKISQTVNGSNPFAPTKQGL